ncbi:hypothetical protein SAMN05443253_107302 [Bacillus sp. OK048]|nr:hypothetical protein SAMN05443253_107302 [Bacillus sp. OK048]
MAQIWYAVAIMKVYTLTNCVEYKSRMPFLLHVPGKIRKNIYNYSKDAILQLTHEGYSIVENSKKLANTYIT